MGLFGESKSSEERSKEMVREWKSKLRREQRQLDRQIHGIEREEFKVTQSLKQAAKKGDKDTARALAKSLVESRKAKNRIHTSKATMNSVLMNIQNQYSMLRVSGALEKSTAVMEAMGKLVNIPEIQSTMRELSKEMTKAGLMEEMMEDTFDSIADDDIEEAADEEVANLLYEITKGELGLAPAVSSHALPEAEAEAEDEAEADEMMARLEQGLQQLRS